MVTEQMDTPIGVINMGATSKGLHLLQFPRRSERDHPFVGSGTELSGTEPDEEAAAHLAEAVRQVREYFDGSRTRFDLALDWDGVTGLRLTVLQLLAKVPFGAAVTYGELAAGAGVPSASQAVGGIMGSNPLPIVVPCHRVLAADGLGGFGGGLRTKEWLLAWEGVLPPALDF
jgi:methylated-DNA-[protein]-cysteine S-methyltransferase